MKRENVGIGQAEGENSTVGLFSPHNKSQLWTNVIEGCQLSPSGRAPGLEAALTEKQNPLWRHCLLKRDVSGSWQSPF